MKNKVVFILLFLIFVSGFVFAIDSEKQIFINEENKNQENQFYSCIVNEKEDKLILLNPLNLMKKGYSITYKDNKVITSVNLLDINDEITVKFQDGNINAKVTRKN